MKDAAEGEHCLSIYPQVDFFLQADSLFNPPVRFVFFKWVTAEHEYNTEHAKYIALSFFMQCAFLSG